ncbi:MAG: hypothetical protein NW202_02955 [Nitrospira sp.]|nr:hypothetical protein [Nitrospira sp.]
MRYSPEAAADIERDLILIRKELRESSTSLLSEVAPLLKNERAREFVRQGVCRRLTIIQRCIRNIFTTFPVERTELLDQDELADIGVNLHAFLINIHGVPDNLAWAYLLERGITLEPKQIGLFNERHTQPHLPQDVLTYLRSDGITKWHGEYAKNYRDALAHRIPPYVAPSVLTPEHQEKYRELEEQIFAAAKAEDFDRALMLTEEQAACGSVCLAFSQSFLDETACDPIILHAQLIVDARTVMQIITVMRPHFLLAC